MVKQYQKVTNELRKELIRLIHVEGNSIKTAAEIANIPYPNAKAINSTFVSEERTSKKNYRYREKNVD